MGKGGKAGIVIGRETLSNEVDELEEERVGVANEEKVLKCGTCIANARLCLILL